jgi:hypothetical protein
LLIRAIKGDNAAPQHPKWIALLTTLITFAVSLLIWIAQFDNSNPGFQFVEKTRLARAASLPYGRGRHLDAVRHPDHVPDAVLHPGQLEVDRPSASWNT